MDFIHKNYINPELECEGEVFKKTESAPLFRCLLM